MVSIEAIEAVLKLRDFFPDFDYDLLILAFSRSVLKSTSLTSRLRRYGIIKMNYQELEYIGDASLRLVVKNMLLKFYNVSLNAYQMTLLESQFLSNKNLSLLVHQLDISKFVNAKNDKDYADVLEAIFGALHLQRYDTYLIADWFLQFPVVKNHPLLFGNSELEGYKKGIECVTPPKTPVLFDATPDVIIVDIPEEVPIRLSKSEVRKHAKEEEDIPEPPYKEIVYEKNIIYPRTSKSFNVDIPEVIVSYEGLQGLYSQYEGKYIAMTEGMTEYHYEQVSSFIDIFKREKPTFTNLNALKKYSFNLKRQFNEINYVNVVAGKLEPFSKITPRSKEGWYGIALVFDVEFRYVVDPEVSFAYRENNIPGERTVSDSPRVYLKRLVTNIKKVINDVSDKWKLREDLQFSPFLYEKARIKVFYFISALTDKEIVFKNNFDKFLSSINSPKVGDNCEISSESLLINLEAMNYCFPALPIKGKHAIPEVLMLSDGKVSKATFEDIRHILPKVDLIEITSEMNNKTDNRGISFKESFQSLSVVELSFYFKLIFLIIKNKYSVEIKTGVIPLLSKWQMTHCYGSYFNIVRDNVIYEVLVSCPMINLLKEKLIENQEITFFTMVHNYLQEIFAPDVKENIFRTSDVMKIVINNAVPPLKFVFADIKEPIPLTSFY